MATVVRCKEASIPADRIKAEDFIYTQNIISKSHWDYFSINQICRLCKLQALHHDRPAPGAMDTNDAIANGICFPYDVLLDILRRVPGRALATSRLVCRSWRGIVDAHGLVLPHVFPREFPGIFAAYHGYEPKSALFGPPASRDKTPCEAGEPTCRGRRPLFWNDWCRVQQHCNGLFLVRPSYICSVLNVYVCNPATLRYARLPLPRPPPVPGTCGTGIEGVFLAFDPAVSRHHEVFYFPTQKMPGTHVEIAPKEPSWIDLEQPFLPNLFREEEPCEEKQLSQQQQHALYVKEPWEIDLEQMLLPYLSEDYLCEEEQPTGERQQESHTEEPAGSTSQSNVQEAKVLEKEVLHLSVFSSRNGEWESREFMPGRCTSRYMYDVVTTPRVNEARRWWSAEYWRGSLYVQCHSGVLMILHCSEGTYNMVQLPGHPYDDEDLPRYELPKRYVLGSCERGICYVVLDKFHLEVWELTELADDQLGWTLAHEANLEAHYPMVNYLSQEPMLQPSTRWEVVESDKDLISLFKVENINKSNDVDGTEEDTEELDEEDDYEEIHAEEDEEQNNADDTQSEVEEEIDSNEEDEQLPSGMGSEYSWNSDEHNFIDFDKINVTGDEYSWGWEIRIVGFHPYKDVLLLKFMDAVVAYHHQTLRMQYLGDIYPRRHCQQARDVHDAFPYRPCYVDALPARKASESS